MKKALSIILAIIMIAAAVPTAFAANDCEHVFNTGKLVRPFDESFNPVADPHFICSACGEKVPVSPADFSEYFIALGMVAGYIDSVYLEGNAIDIMGNYFAGSYACEHIDEIVYKYTEYEQNIVDAYTAEVLDMVAGAPAVIKENNLTLVLDATTGDTGIWYMNWGMTFFENAINKVTLSLSEEVMTDFYEIVMRFSEISAMEPDDITPELVAEYDNLSKDFAAFYFNVVNCAIGDHTLTEATDNGDGTHSGICSFCSSKETEEHTGENDCDICDFFVEIEEEKPEDEPADKPVDTPEEKEPFSLEELIKAWADILKDFFELIRSFFASVVK